MKKKARISFPSPAAPVVLVSSEIEAKGREFGDYSVNLSVQYERALANSGAIPWIVPTTTHEGLVAEVVRRTDGLMLTGGDDVNPGLYGSSLSAPLRGKVHITPDGGERDLRECLLVREALRQGKPILAICRGQQILNVAMGGTLMPDIPSANPKGQNHRRMDQRAEIVHEVKLTPGSLLAKITGKQRLGVNSTHHQAVARVAPGLRVTALSDDGIIEALEGNWCGSLTETASPVTCSKLPFLVSVQFHPERLEDRYWEHRAIFRAFVAACAQKKIL